jgi:hypothetical protein
MRPSAAVCGVGAVALAPHLEPRGVYFFLALLDRRGGCGARHTPPFIVVLSTPDDLRCLTPKRCSSGQLYSEGARGTPSGTRRARDKLISVLACNKGVFATLFPSLAPPRNAKVGRAGLMKAARMGC